MKSVAIIGRPNVGKSTLFNALLKKKHAITHQTAGVTRDIKKIETHIGTHKIQLIDTGGISRTGALSSYVSALSKSAIEDSDVIVLLVSCEDLSPEDEEIIALVRKKKEKLILAVNKVDNEQREWLAAEFYSLGLGDPVMISAAHRINIDVLETRIEDFLEQHKNNCRDEKDTKESSEPELNSIHTQTHRIKLLILGKPNTGKSSLLNALLNQERVLVSEIAGTTRDIIEEDVELFGTKLTILDSAGLRRKNKIIDDIEYYASHRAISAIEHTDVVLLLIDVVEGLSEQDKKIAELVLRRGKGLIIGLNKWDLIKEQSNRLNAERDRIFYKVPQLHYVELCPLSAKEHTGFEHVIASVKKIYSQLFTQINTSLLNRELQKWVEKNPPPYLNRRRGKLKFIYQVSQNPIIFKLKVNNPDFITTSYKQYIINNIRRSHKLSNIPIILDLITN